MLTASTSLKAQEVTVVLNPGWTWISFPGTEPQSFATALGSFVPMEGDMIKSQWGNASFRNGQWKGQISQFYPGYGYHYKSNRQVPETITMGNPLPSLSVTTAEPTDITSYSATSGGSITTDAYIFTKGICWATHPEPTPMDDDHSENGGGDESFTAEMTDLNQNTTYYVRAYAVTQNGIVYGNEVSFTTIPIWTIEATPNPTEGGTITGTGDYEQNAVCTLTAIANEGYVFANWTENGEVVSTDATYSFTVDASRTLVANFNLDHTYVDLGLPSGLLWATCNLGANIPEEYGDYFAWGETQPKDNFSWTNYQYCMGSFNTLTKYCNNPDIGYNGFTDDLTTLLPEDDAATANWGDEWRMPTEGEWQELYENTTVTWTTRNGVRGRLFTATNGNSIFMPASGYCNESAPEAAGIIGDYWTSSLDTDYPSGALSFFFNSSNYYISFCNRLYGRNVRAVRPSQNHAYVDLGLPSGLLWATCNVGADNPEDYGDYFAWGETTTKGTYDWSNYQYNNGGYEDGLGNFFPNLTKYCNNPDIGYNGFTDNLTTLLPEDDAVTANWGGNWRMPTQAEFQELLDNTTVTWTTQNGVNGRLFTAANGNSLFLPAAGCRFHSSSYWAGSCGYYWSSSLYTDYPRDAWLLCFESYDCGVWVEGDVSYRSCGNSVRAVRSSSQNNTPTGAINGKFTINANGDQIYFSQGNLQYQASTNTWKFAENQYDYVGSTNSNISSTYSGWIDLFGWGTSGYNHGANCYQPWSTSQTNSDYYAYGSYTYNLYDQTGQADWGYNPISNGGNTVNQWRTLTQPEWNYMFNTRTTTSGIRYAKANVNNVNGVILLPDDWSTGTYSLSSTNTYNASFSSNMLTASQWSTLEQAGAVFLPAAGYRFGTSVIDVGSDGYYWSASYYDSYYAYYVFFNDSSLYADVRFGRYNGRSVRLVAPAEN